MGVSRHIYDAAFDLVDIFRVRGDFWRIEENQTISDKYGFSRDESADLMWAATSIVCGDPLTIIEADGSEILVHHRDLRYGVRENSRLQEANNA